MALRNGHSRPLLAASCIGAVALGAGLAMTVPSLGFDRYKNADLVPPAANCSTCHGDFTDGTSPQGTVFPSNNKHTMHRSSSNMNTDCDLCHTAGDERNPFLDSSDGTNDTPGLGCAGCHSGPGLRLHHVNSGVDLCLDCHDDGPPTAENLLPPYYGSFDTNVFDPCNTPEFGFNENWSVGDTQGLDNDGDLLYDTNDPDCGGGDPCPEDTNGDGEVNVLDLVNVVLCWGGTGEDCPDPGNNSDTDPDGVVNVFDLTAVILAWGSCPG